MDLQRRDEYKQRLFELIPPDGKTISNEALRTTLAQAFLGEQFTLDDYWDLRRSLIEDGKIERARGRGGSVRRVVEVLVADSPTSPPEATITPWVEARESALYEPFRKVIETGFVPDEDFKPWVCETTAAQGRRSTGGRWTRPDVTLIGMQTFAYVPDKLFEVVTFEIKPNLDTALDGVYEAAAHAASAHRSYLAFPDSEEYQNNLLFDRIRNECERFGLGLILFEKVDDWDTYSFEVEAQPKARPDPQAVNDFIKTQISVKSREDIQRWFR